MAYVVPLFVLIPLGIGLRNYPRLQMHGKLIVLYLCCSAIASAIAALLGMNNINNMPVFHIFTMVEFVVLTLFFRQLAESGIWRSTISVLGVLFILFGILNCLFIQPIFTYNSLPRSLESLLLIIYGLQWFYSSLGSTNRSTQVRSLVWINSGIICYFSGSLFLFIFNEYVVQHPTSYRIAWLTHAVFVAAFLYATITIYLIKTTRK